MKRIFGWLGVFLIGSVGWWLGGYWNFTAAALLSLIGSAVGLYWGRRIYDDYIDWR